MLDQIKIENFKSIKDATLKFKNINVLIGANGSGKSNFISLFKLLNNITEKRLQSYIAENDGADNILHFGQKESDYLNCEIIFDSFNNSALFDKHIYKFKLNPTNEGKLYFNSEIFGIKRKDQEEFKKYNKINNSNFETNLYTCNEKGSKFIIDKLKDFKIYHFHDTSISAKIKKSCNIEDNEILKEDGSNLAAFLFKLQKENELILKRIESTIKLITPYFDKFILKPSIIDENKIKLLWQEKNSDVIFTANNLSDRRKI